MVPAEDLSKGAFRLVTVDNFLVLPSKTPPKLSITSSDVLPAVLIVLEDSKMD